LLLDIKFKLLILFYVIHLVIIYPSYCIKNKEKMFFSPFYLELLVMFGEKSDLWDGFLANV
jgi:hypothetical protein